MCRTASTCATGTPRTRATSRTCRAFWKPLEPFKQNFNLLGNLTHNAGRALLDGAGDHGRCLRRVSHRRAAPPKTMVDIKAGGFVRSDRRQPSPRPRPVSNPSKVGMEDSRQAGDCDSGYSCAYTNNLAWRSETQPLPPILNPRNLLRPALRRRRRAQPRSTQAAQFVSPQCSRYRLIGRQTPLRRPRSDRPAQAGRVSIFHPRN